MNNKNLKNNKGITNTNYMTHPENTKNNSINYVANSLQYYDENIEKYGPFLKKAKYMKLFVGNNNEPDYLQLYDAKKNKIVSSKYEVIGSFNNISHTWTWAWSLPHLKKSTISISKKIINYGIDLGPESLFLKTELITSRFRITNPIQLDIHIALASYLSKQKVVFKYKAYLEPIVDDDNMLDLQNEPSESPDYYVIYYMFLLDTDDIFNGINNSGDNGSNSANINNTNSDNSNSDNSDINSSNSDNPNSDSSNSTNNDNDNDDNDNNDNNNDEMGNTYYM